MSNYITATTEHHYTVQVATGDITMFKWSIFSSSWMEKHHQHKLQLVMRTICPSKINVCTSGQKGNTASASEGQDARFQGQDTRFQSQGKHQRQSVRTAATTWKVRLHINRGDRESLQGQVINQVIMMQIALLQIFKDVQVTQHQYQSYKMMNGVLFITEPDYAIYLRSIVLPVTIAVQIGSYLGPITYSLWLLHNAQCIHVSVM